MARRFLIATVYALPVLVTLLAILLGAAWFVDALADRAGARVLRGGAAAVVIFLMLDLILLLGVLGIRAVQQMEDEHEPPS